MDRRTLIVSGLVTLGWRASLAKAQTAAAAGPAARRRPPPPPAPPPSAAAA